MFVPGSVKPPFDSQHIASRRDCHDHWLSYRQWCKIGSCIRRVVQADRLWLQKVTYAITCSHTQTTVPVNLNNVSIDSETYSFAFPQHQFQRILVFSRKKAVLYRTKENGFATNRLATSRDWTDFEDGAHKVRNRRHGV